MLRLLAQASSDHVKMTMMGKRPTSLLLLLVLASSVCAGMPLHSNEQECAMPEMAGMDCCKRASRGETTSEGLIAQLCCSLNCSQDGTTGSKSAQLPQPLVVQLNFDRISLTQPPAVSPFSSFRFNREHSPPQYSNPAYIRHLALLI